MVQQPVRLCNADQAHLQQAEEQSGASLWWPLGLHCYSAAAAAPPCQPEGCPETTSLTQSTSWLRHPSDWLGRIAVQATASAGTTVLSACSENMRRGQLGWGSGWQHLGSDRPGTALWGWCRCRRCCRLGCWRCRHALWSRRGRAGTEACRAAQMDLQVDVGNGIRCGTGKPCF